MNTIGEAVRDYLALRRAIGLKPHDIDVGLLDFAAFLEQQNASFITISLALEWAQKPSGAQPTEWSRRLGWIRGFARYRSATDVRTEVPPLGLLPHRRRKLRPYIYSAKEIEALLKAALNLPPEHGLRRWTYYCLFGLLAVSGLRIGEALALTDEDVDLAQGLLRVRGKFDKVRLVPLHASTQEVLSDYKARRDRLLAGWPSSYFFRNRKQGTRLHRSNVLLTFYALSRQIGLRGPTSSHGPRLHDFRHRFAVKTLVRWYEAGENVEQRLPSLSTFLGHVHWSSTYWYFHNHPELMGRAVSRLEKRWEVKS